MESFTRKVVEIAQVSRRYETEKKYHVKKKMTKKNTPENRDYTIEYRVIGVRTIITLSPVGSEHWTSTL